MAKESGSSFLSDAPLGVVVCGKEKESDVWIEDCSIASIILQLTGQSLGLGSCWIQIRRRLYGTGKSSEEYVKEVLSLPESLRVESIIAFGYPDEVKNPIPIDKLEYDKILQLKNTRCYDQHRVEPLKLLAGVTIFSRLFSILLNP